VSYLASTWTALEYRLGFAQTLKYVAIASGAAQVKGTGTAHLGTVENAPVGARETSFTVKTTARRTSLARRIGAVAAGLNDIAPIGTGATRLGRQFRSRCNGARQARLTIGWQRALFKRAQFATSGRRTKESRRAATTITANSIVADRIGSTDGRLRDALVDISARRRRAGKAHLAHANKTAHGIETIFRRVPARRDTFGTLVAIDTPTVGGQRSIAIVALTGIGAGRIAASAIGSTGIGGTAFIDIGTKGGGGSAGIAANAGTGKGPDGIGAIGIGAARRPVPTFVAIDARAVQKLIAGIAIARVRADGIDALAIETAGTEFALVDIGTAGQRIAFVARSAFAIVGSRIAAGIVPTRRLGVGKAFAQRFIGRLVILKARLVIAHVFAHVSTRSFLVKGKPIHPKGKQATHLDGLVEWLA
jgi:hypothetical protein